MTRIPSNATLMLLSPVALGRGESLLAGIDLLQLGFKCTEQVISPAAMHVVLRK